MTTGVGYPLYRAYRVFNMIMLPWLLLLSLSIAVNALLRQPRTVPPKLARGTPDFGDCRRSRVNSYDDKTCRANHVGRSSTHLAMVDPTLVSVGGGAVAGAIGLGVAFPFDSLKTKAQALSASGEESTGMIALMRRVYNDEGIAGFYGGVSGAMAGQAMI